jgi:hypothetical protein
MSRSSQRSLLPLKSLLALPILAVACASAQQPPKDAKALVSAAAATELEADHNDRSAYMYRDHDVAPDHDTVVLTIETPQGNLHRKVEDHGKPLTPADRQADDASNQKLLHDPALQKKLRKDTNHDDSQAEELLKLLPYAFVWTVAEENGDLITLDFKRNPSFQAPNMEARVFASMEGQIVVAKGDNRIRTIRGRMMEDVKILGGVFGGLHKGGTFDVERREVAPHHWQVTELHVHITGKVFFATIGSQEDEWKTEFKPSPAQTLEQAWEIATAPTTSNKTAASLGRPQGK